MSGKGKIGGKHPSLSKSNKAGLIFPVGRISRWIRDGNFAPRSGLGAAVFLAAVLEYMTSEVLEIAGGHVKETGKQRITPQHLQHAVRRDRELAELLANVTIVEGGVLPNDHLLQHSMKKKSKTVKPVTNEQPANTNVAADEEEDEAF